MTKSSFMPKPIKQEDIKLVLQSVHKLNADGTKTDITDRPELWFPEIPTDPKELLKLRLWKIINDELNFFELKKH